MEFGCHDGEQGSSSMPRSCTDRFFLHQTRAPAFTSTLRTYASDAKATPTEVSSILEQRIRGVQEENSLAETGRVLSVGYAASPSHAKRGSQAADEGTVTVSLVSMA